jgi:hypothetical protein
MKPPAKALMLGAVLLAGALLTFVPLRREVDGALAEDIRVRP